MALLPKCFTANVCSLWTLLNVETCLLMSIIGSVFHMGCDVRCISNVTLSWHEIVVAYNTEDTAVSEG